MDVINSKYREESTIKALLEDYQSASPYPHIVMDNFLSQEFADSLSNNFPEIEKLDIHWKGLNENKSEGASFDMYHDDFKKMKSTITSSQFYDWIEQVTGVKDGLITDDKLGCGVHQGKDGSFLDVHVDFNMHHLNNKYRRLNLLVYLNPGWKTEEYGGELEMWNANMTKCEKKVAPIHNRAVIFETNHYSYHGYSQISLPPDVFRRSFYAYVYTDDQGNQKSYHDTTFKARPDDNTSKKVKTAAKETLKNGVKKTLKKLGIKF